MKTFRNTQFVSAVVFLLLAVSFTLGNDGVQWIWKETPVVGAISAAVSFVFWGFCGADGSIVAVSLRVEILLP